MRFLPLGLALLSLLPVAALAACAGQEASFVLPGRDVVSLRPLPPMVAEQAGADRLADESLSALRARLPRRTDETDGALFRRKDDVGAIWSAAALTALDLSGVAWGPGAMATLITDRHVIASAHVIGPVGNHVTFYTREGWPIRRVVTAKAELRRDPQAGAPLDTVVARLDAPVPSGVQVYPLAAAPEGGVERLAAARMPVIVTYRNGRIGIGTLFGTRGAGARVSYAEGHLGLGPLEGLTRRARGGDSGHPSFLLVNGELLLFSHYHTNELAGAGPAYAEPSVRDAITEAIRRLDAEAAARPAAP